MSRYSTLFSNVTKTINPDGTYTLARYNDKNMPLVQVDESKNVTINEYDDKGVNVIKNYKSLTSVANADAIVQNTFNLSSLDYTNYAMTVYTYYEYGENFTTALAGLVCTITDSEGNITEYTYYESGYGKGLPQTKTIKDGNTIVNTVEYKYNSQLQVSEEKTSVDLTASTPVYSIRKYEYDKFNNVTKTEDYGTGSTAIISIAEYDKLSRKTAEYAPKYSADKSHGTLYTFYPSGSVKTETDAIRNISSFEYDAYGNATKKTNPDGTINITEYDGLQREIKTYFKPHESSTKQILTATEYEFVKDQSFDIYTSLNSSSSKSYCGLRTTKATYITTEKQVVTETLADFRGNVVTEKTNTETKRTSAYYANGQLARQTDALPPQEGALANTTKYEYGTLNKLTKTYVPFNTKSDGTVNYSVSENQYDKNGNVILTKQTVQKQDSATVKYSVVENEYNALGLLSKVKSHALFSTFLQL